MKKLCFIISLAFVAVQTSAAGLKTISDVRVAPLIESHWGQKSDTGYSNTGSPCFNYYTPNRGPCGCSAVAMAQIMRYWMYPSSAPSGRYQCAVNDEPVWLSIEPGVYDCSLMPLVTTNGLDEAERAAIGKLTYDCAVALHTGFYSSGARAFSDFSFSILKDTFRFANAVGYCPNGGISFADIRAALYSNLDAGCPVMISLLTADDLGHQVIADGYGFEGSTEYVHLNMGWNDHDGEDDIWYPLPDVDAKDNSFSKIDGIVYNIFPYTTGDILSGRVLSAEGEPVPNATVTAKAKSSREAFSEVTDERGVYAFILPGGVTYTVSCGGTSREVKLAKSVSAVCDWSDPLWPSMPSTRTGTCGNSWGNDLILSNDPSGGDEPGDDDPSQPVDEFGPFNPAKAVSGAFPYTGALYDGEGTPCGTVSLKVGKPNAKKMTTKVSGSIVMVNGKKYTIKSATVPVDPVRSVEVRGMTVTKLGSLDLRLGQSGFLGVLNCSDGSSYEVRTIDLSGGLATDRPVFEILDPFPETWNGASVLSDFLPDGERFEVTAKGKWVFRKAASIKFKKVKETDPVTGKKVSVSMLTGFDDPEKPNLSGLKLTYTAKTGVFKGTFYFYSIAGTEAKPKLVKTKATVNGLVIDGRGIGLATAKAGGQTFVWRVEF